jgi:hypothetical protein
VDLRAGLDAVKKRKSFDPAGNRNPAVQHEACYCTIPALLPQVAKMGICQLLKRR